jgi:hypothetical protein
MTTPRGPSSSAYLDPQTGAAFAAEPAAPDQGFFDLVTCGKAKKVLIPRAFLRFIGFS